LSFSVVRSIAKKGSDISIAKPEVWSGRKLTEQEVEALATPPQKLVDEYWTVISQFLQHCTQRRFEEFRDWDLQEMWDKLKAELPMPSPLEDEY
jgi:hypothetical protein